MKLLALLFTVFALLASSGCRRPEVIVTRQNEITEFEFKNRSTIPPVIEKKEPREPLKKENFSPYTAIKNEYRIQEGDILEVMIFSEKETISKEAPVAPDGRLYFLFVDGVQAEGRTLKEVATDITAKISHLYPNAEVSVFPKKVVNQHYMILGKVGKAGVYPITSSVTLRQAIGDAGGIAYGGYKGTTIAIASLRESFIVREGKKLDVDFSKLLFSEGSDQDIYVLPGDYIYIASSLVKQVYLIGNVKEQKPIPYFDGMTLVQAISGPSGVTGGFRIGGWEAANVSQIMIVRGSLSSPQVMCVNLYKIIDGSARDVYLQPGDIVYIPNKKFRFGRELVRLAVDTFVQEFGTAAGEYYASKEWFKSGP